MQKKARKDVVKIFLEKNGATMQKVAEFNSEHSLFRHLSEEDKILKVSRLRNERIETTKRIFGLDNVIYHCITRIEKEKFIFRNIIQRRLAILI